MPEKAERAGRKVGPFSVFAALSLLSVSAGCFAAARSGAPVAEWARNLVAWLVGMVCAAALARWAGRRSLWVTLAATPVALGLTFFDSGLDGVHRWVQLGPLRMNAAEALAPAAVVACAGLLKRGPLAAGVAILSLALLAAQPDTSQAAAFGGALLVLLIGAPGAPVRRFVAGAVVVGLVAMSRVRPDPLAPVADVEGIMALALAVSPLLALGAWVGLAGSALAPLVGEGGPEPAARTAAFALAAYSVVAALMPLAGAFPAPLVGMGVSPILGLWLGIGLLSALAARTP